MELEFETSNVNVSANIGRIAEKLGKLYGAKFSACEPYSACKGVITYPLTSTEGLNAQIYVRHYQGFLYLGRYEIVILIKTDSQSLEGRIKADRVLLQEFLNGLINSHNNMHRRKSKKSK